MCPGEPHAKAMRHHHPKRAGDIFVTKRLHLGWALHNHQPVGNFPAVFEDIYVRAYEPLVAALERHPTIRLTLHYTGPVLEWLDAQQPTFLERLPALGRAGPNGAATGRLVRAALSPNSRP